MSELRTFRRELNGCIYHDSVPESRAKGYMGGGWVEVEGVKVARDDAIVIDRADLPEVTVKNGVVEANGAEDPYSTSVSANPNWAWHYGLNALAVSLYLREHPPVDEAQVLGIAQALAADYDGEPVMSERLKARRLYERGVRFEEASES